MNKLIYIVDDEEDILNLVLLHLKKNNYQAKGFLDGNSLFRALKEEIPALLILDLMLPDIDGLEICKSVKNDKRLKNVPVIMLTAKQDETDKVLGLELGADDYVTKPFSPRELIARVKAVLRRGINIEESNTITVEGYFKIDRDRHEVYDKNNNRIELTLSEFKILEALAERIGWTFSRDKLLFAVWGNDRYVIDRTIDVHIKHIREKLGEAAKIIKNVRGVGYKIDMDE